MPIVEFIVAFQEMNIFYVLTLRFFEFSITTFHKATIFSDYLECKKS